jgi:hypothetical protein
LALLQCEAPSEETSSRSQALVTGLEAEADTFVSRQRKNKNFGSRKRLVVSSKSDGLLRFDSTEIAAAVGDGALVSAHLELTRYGFGQAPLSLGGEDAAEAEDGDDDECLEALSGASVKSTLLEVYRLEQSWTEAGATYHCDVDTLPTNNKKNCSPGWDPALASAEAPTASAWVTTSGPAVVTLDVTPDVAAMLATPSENHGWRITKGDGSPRKVRFHSRESNSTPSRPRLVLDVQPSGGSGGQGGIGAAGATSSTGAGAMGASGGAGAAGGSGPTGAGPTGAGPTTGVGAGPTTTITTGVGAGPTTITTTGVGAGGAGGAAASGGAGAGGAGAGDVGAGGQGGEPPCEQIVDDGDPSTIDRCDPTSGAVIRVPVPSLDATLTTTPSASLAFLHEGPDAIQVGVAPGTIDPVRGAGLVGHVLYADGAAAMNVSVTVLGHPEYGVTLTDANGRYALAVNGGEPLTIVAEKAGFLEAQRTTRAEWDRITTLPPLRILAPDPNATAIDLGAIAEVTAAVGSVESDAEGSRQGVVLVTPGTSAVARLADGTSVALPNLTLRITEFTVGEAGPERMPASLPEASAYTYAMEIQADEAALLGARRIDLSEPVSYFVENFTGAPVGGRVPLGYYDRDRGTWIAEPDGHVLEVLDVDGGVASIDATGDGVAEDDATLESLGISFEERVWLAERYTATTTLWHVSLSHFSWFDINFIKFCPPSACTIPPSPQAQGEDDQPCEQTGSTIECTNQTFGEDVPVVGTPFRLHYRSDRVPGRVAGRSVTLDVTDATVPAQLERIEVELQVAGRTITREITCPCAPNQRITLEWDGLDAFGRATQGPQKAFVALYYHYPNAAQTRVGPLVDDQGPTFGAISGEDAIGIALGRSAGNLTLARGRDVDLGSFRNDAYGLGGHSLDAVHGYAVVGQTIYRGDGTRRRNDEVLSVLDAIVVNPVGTNWTDLTVGPDGATWLVANGTLVRRSVAGTTEIVGAQFEQPCSTADGTPAASACYTRDLSQLAFGPDGSLFGVQYFGRIVRIDPARRVSVVAGTGTGGVSGDGGPATNAQILAFTLAIGPDGSI